MIDGKLEKLKAQYKKYDYPKSTEVHHFPKSYRFPRDFGEWVITTTKGQTVKSKNLEELEKYPGITVTNTHHEYGYKFNKLQDRWMVYDFETGKVI